MNRALSKIIIILIFVLAGVLFFHNLTSINADIGRHIKLGEIIWQNKEVPKTNLFSFTAPDFPFINHHWLSEVIFYGIFNIGGSWSSGLQSVIIFKALVLLVTYFILYLTVRRHNIFAVFLSFLISIFVFSARTEPRPEIFSYLFFAIYLLIIYRTRISNFEFRISNQFFNNLIFKLRNYKIYSKLKIRNLKFQLSWLWFLPLIQLFWVNMHIYFAIGPVIYLLFLIDRFINSKFKNYNKVSERNENINFHFRTNADYTKYNFIQNSKLEITILFLIMLANFANPNFVAGALYPLKVLGSYGYSVAENSSLFFLAKYFGSWAPQDKLFLISFFILMGSFIINLWQTKKLLYWLKTRTFDLLLVAITTALSFKMQRNIPLFALSLWPVMAKNLDDFSNFEFLQRFPALHGNLLRAIFNLEKLKRWLYTCAIFVLIASVYLVVSNRFYNWLDSAKRFGVSVSSAAQEGINFVKENGIQGPVFNNFDIGSYLVWQIQGVRYPIEKAPDPFRVFVDGRPEAYPVEFFEDIYKPMQRDQKVWREKSEKYGINYIFFAHTDMTEWGEEFLTRISKDKEWPMVFLNDSVVIFLKNTDANRPAIDKYKIIEDNIAEKIPQVLVKLDKNDDNAFVNFGNALYRFRWLTGSAKVFEALVENQPNNPYGYQGAGYAYASMNDPATQQKAADNLQKAIELGFKTFNNYFTLGIVNANLGNYFAAEENITKALKIKPDNRNARQTLETISKKQRINFQ